MRASFERYCRWAPGTGVETATLKFWERGTSNGSGVARAREEYRGFFDRFAGRSAAFVSRAPFFVFCVLLVVVWAPGNFDTYQLLINTPTTIVTFLLVALLQN